MKRDFASRLLFPLCGMLALTVTSCNKTAKDQPSRHRFIHNNDGSDALLNRWFGGHPAHKADIDRYVDMVADTSKGRTQVTTFMMCSGSDFIYYPSSKYGRYFGDDKNGTMPYADSATKKVWQLGGQSVRNLEAEGTDVIKASLERAKMHGMEAFITYRVNDLHFADSSSGNPATFPDFWIEHPEYWTGDSTQGAQNVRRPAGHSAEGNHRVAQCRSRRRCHAVRSGAPAEPLNTRSAAIRFQTTQSPGCNPNHTAGTTRR